LDFHATAIEEYFFPLVTGVTVGARTNQKALHVRATITMVIAIIFIKHSPTDGASRLILDESLLGFFLVL
jgi:hypothetical protein